MSARGWRTLGELLFANAVLAQQAQQTELLGRIADQQLAAFAADHPDLYQAELARHRRQRRTKAIMLVTLVGVTIIPLLILLL